MRDHVKRTTFAGAAAVGAATAVTALLIGSTAAVADETGPTSSAYGISAAGLLTINPTPSVASRDGEPAHDELLKLAPAENVSLGVLTVDAQGGAARTSVAEVRLLDLVKADLITTSCRDGKGQLEIVNGSVLGTKLPSHPISGQKIDVSPLLTVTLGQETRNDDDSITVTGIVLTVLPGTTDRDTKLTGEERSALPGLSGLSGARMPAAPATAGDVLDALGGTRTAGDHAVQVVTIGSATCGAQHGADHGDEHADTPPSDAPATGDQAPKPEVVEAHLPVTG